MERERGMFTATEYQVQTTCPAGTFREFLDYLQKDTLPTLTDDNFHHWTELANEFEVASLKPHLEAFHPTPSDEPTTAAPAEPPAPLAAHPALDSIGSDIANLQEATARLSLEIAECQHRLAVLEPSYRSISDLYELIEDARVDDLRFQRLQTDVAELKKSLDRVNANSRQFIANEREKLDAAAESFRNQHNAQAETLALEQREFLAQTNGALGQYRRDVGSKFAALDSLVGTFRSEYSGRTEKRFELAPGREMDGIVRHLSGREGDVRVTSSFEEADPLREANNVIDFDSLKDFITDDEEGQWVCLEFRSSSVRVDGYAIVGANGLFPRSWVVEVSWDNASWTEISVKENARELTTVSQAVHYATDEQFEGRFVRFRLTGRNSDGLNTLQLRAFEVFGTYRDVETDGVEQRMRNIEAGLATVCPRPVYCLQHPGLPLRGILRFMAERNRGNLHEGKVVEVRGTAVKGDISQIVDPASRTVVVLQPEGQEPPTLIVDFKERKVIATHFGVEIGDANQNPNQPRSVAIQGFDGREWRDLFVGNLVKQCYKSVSGVCPVTICMEASQFRIQHKETKNRDMGIMKFEVFGTFFE
jgi:hypothetical protein